ncbi:hypothetical protein TRP8649_01880 [Pelagimonas phthalicica]|uniref:Uncharacterized protein n=1 Tax=Pelagimonas phthalicica TaxID=1037362 RepID=A0A238JAP1_9RHOB|nr:hypothetical protein CLV87_0192 [Pelagimonas phthalicica]SMX27770.1 hypothetical protein TRP8649_01880 [Pelagimonas phthalicica]
MNGAVELGRCPAPSKLGTPRDIFGPEKQGRGA